MLRRLVACSLVGALAGCQSYNFSPVGKCYIQPGSTRIQLSSLATADILFVVDDSGSMNPHQQALAQNFKSFINALASKQQQRISKGLDPLEFHVAITTSSVFEGHVAQYGSASGGVATCGGSPLICDIQNPYGRLVATAQNQPWTAPYTYACTARDAACIETVDRYYDFNLSLTDPDRRCRSGVGVLHDPFPSGDFVRVGSNPRVMHFTKDLNWSTWAVDPSTKEPLSSVDPAIVARIQQFKDNIAVGTCGSGMEQHLEAGRLAVKKALRLDGLAQPADVKLDEWPHPGAKLLVVWIGDEDDCSNPKDPSKALAFNGLNETPGADICVADDSATPPKKYPVEDYATFFTGLGRPFGAAFVYSALSCRPDGNGNTVCDAGKCGCDASGCIGKSDGKRFNSLAKGFRDRGIKTFEASVCDADWSTTLSNIAELVTPPPGLKLPTQPASGDVAALRIQSADGSSSRLCNGPGDGQDWTFVDCGSGAALPAGATADSKGQSCVAINHNTGHCEANPGETYIAQYLGVVPAGGCLTQSDCATALGGSALDWTCTATGSVRGTCLCNGAP